MADNGNTRKADQLVSFTKSASPIVLTNASTNRLNTDFENAGIDHLAFNPGDDKTGQHSSVRYERPGDRTTLHEGSIRENRSEKMSTGSQPGVNPADASAANRANPLTWKLLNLIKHLV